MLPRRSEATLSSTRSLYPYALVLDQQSYYEMCYGYAGRHRRELQWRCRSALLNDETVCCLLVYAAMM